MAAVEIKLVPPSFKMATRRMSRSVKRNLRKLISQRRFINFSRITITGAKNPVEYAAYLPVSPKRRGKQFFVGFILKVPRDLKKAIRRSANRRSFTGFLKVQLAYVRREIKGLGFRLGGVGNAAEAIVKQIMGKATPITVVRKTVPTRPPPRKVPLRVTPTKAAVLPRAKVAGSLATGFTVTIGSKTKNTPVEAYATVTGNRPLKTGTLDDLTMQPKVKTPIFKIRIYLPKKNLSKNADAYSKIVARAINARYKKMITWGTIRGNLKTRRRRRS